MARKDSITSVFAGCASPPASSFAACATPPASLFAACAAPPASVWTECGGTPPPEDFVRALWLGAQGLDVGSYVGEVNADFTYMPVDPFGVAYTGIARLSGDGTIYQATGGSPTFANAASNLLAAGVPPSRNYYAEARVEMRSAMIGQVDSIGLLLRVGGRSIYGCWNNTPTAIRWEVYVNGVGTVAAFSASAPLSAGGSKLLRVVGDERVIALLIDGVELIHYTDTADSAPGLVGVRLFNNTLPSNPNSKLHLGPFNARALA